MKLLGSSSSNKSHSIIRARAKAHLARHPPDNEEYDPAIICFENPNPRRTLIAVPSSVFISSYESISSIPYSRSRNLQAQAELVARLVLMRLARASLLAVSLL
jgi:hypothetical protein